MKPLKLEDKSPENRLQHIFALLQSIKSHESMSACLLMIAFDSLLITLICSLYVWIEALIVHLFLNTVALSLLGKLIETLSLILIVFFLFLHTLINLVGLSKMAFRELKMAFRELIMAFRELNTCDDEKRDCGKENK
jgi:hypothetical protein